jgi:hypothetical protein
METTNTHTQAQNEKAPYVMPKSLKAIVKANNDYKNDNFTMHNIVEPFKISRVARYHVVGTTDKHFF